MFKSFVSAEDLSLSLGNKFVIPNYFQLLLYKLKYNKYYLSNFQFPFIHFMVLGRLFC